MRLNSFLLLQRNVFLIKFKTILAFISKIDIYGLISILKEPLLLSSVVRRSFFIASEKHQGPFRKTTLLTAKDRLRHTSVGVRQLLVADGVPWNVTEGV
jgi:hypothetical protein